jgi:curved DNA-binding protein CbpA
VDHYDVLGVTRDADPAAVRRAYLDLARRHHPDRDGGDPDAMRAVNEAWATLGDPVKRRRYDLTVGGPGPWTAGPTGPPATSDERDLQDDLADDRPFGGGVPASGWFAVVPVALFAASMGFGLFGVLLGLPAVVGLAVLAFALSCLAFVAAPLLSLYASRRSTPARSANPGGRADPPR